MDTQQALSFLFQRADATQTFWNFYATTATALLAFLAAAKAKWINRTVCMVLMVGFIVFAGANYWALDQVRAQRAALTSLIPKLPSYQPFLDDLIESANPPSAWGLRLFRGVLDCAVVSLIWAIPNIRQRYSPPAAASLDPDAVEGDGG